MVVGAAAVAVNIGTARALRRTASLLGPQLFFV